MAFATGECRMTRIPLYANSRTFSSVAEQSHCSLHVKELKVTTTQLETETN